MITVKTKAKRRPRQPHQRRVDDTITTRFVCPVCQAAGEAYITASSAGS